MNLCVVKRPNELKPTTANMNETSATVSIVIPCRNEAAHIEKCLRSIFGQEVGAGGLEVILADGVSDDGTREILNLLAARDRRLRIVDNPHQIVSTGLNAAIQAAAGQIIIRMDVHTEYASDYVRQCLLVLEETGADNVGGPWIARGDGYMGNAIAAAFQTPFAVGGARGHNPEYEGYVDTVYLGCWRRELFNRIGFFDEELVRNQDDEFNLRLVRSGGRIWQSPRIQSWYQPRISLSNLFRQYTQYGYWKVRVIQKHRLPASIRHLAPAGFVASLVVLAALSPFWGLPAYGLAALAATYSLCAITAAAIAAARHGLKLLPVLPVVFACYHFSYGLGFLRGLWDFILLGRASLFAKGLTRSSRPATSGESGLPIEDDRPSK
jgi:succinoglycan biosynthesis protein ExoA